MPFESPSNTPTIYTNKQGRLVPNRRPPSIEAITDGNEYREFRQRGRLLRWASHVGRTLLHRQYVFQVADHSQLALQDASGHILTSYSILFHRSKISHCADTESTDSRATVATPDHTSSLFSRLPPELLLRVVDFVSISSIHAINDLVLISTPQFLSYCALTCREWAKAIQPRLFQRIAIVSHADLPTLP